MSEQHYFTEIDQLNDRLEQQLDELRQAGRDKAKAEHDYRVELATMIWQLRADKQPVTIVPDLARGDERIAYLKLVRDAAESDYKATIEAINVTKLQVRVISEQIARDWGRPSNM